LPDRCFWSRAMSWPAPGRIDPAVGDHRIDPSAKVATLGSCFSQQISKRLGPIGLTYFIAERADPKMGAEEAAARNYGIFSARYGNVYSVRQALQLFQRAFGAFAPAEVAWKLEEGFVDPFRPRIEPRPFGSVEEVRRSAVEHLGYVREVFRESDWIVFTLGLTEAWRSKADGAVYPIAPGVHGGELDPDRHEFVNFGIDEVRRDLFALIEGLREVNPKCRMVLTVSPVSMIATYEDRHVLTSTTCSKAVLRVAADEAERRFDQVVYFPSYEVVVSPAAGGRYYADDLRQVSELGIQHVMRLFEAHFVTGTPPEPAAPDGVSLAGWTPPDVVCDEDAIELFRKGRT
jgi:GSCFA family